MFSISNLFSVLLAITTGMSLSACGAEAPLEATPPAQEQEAPEEPADAASNLTVTAGTEHYRGFLLDNVLHAPEGDIHYHIYVPDDYDGSEPYALYLTLPGYEGLYFQGVGQNLYSEDFAFEALYYNDQMIVAAPQLNDWGGDLGGADHHPDGVSAGCLQHRSEPGLRQRLLRRRGDHVPRHGNAARSIYSLSPMFVSVGRGLRAGSGGPGAGVFRHRRGR